MAREETKEGFKVYELPYEIPEWCHMSLDEHECCGGCWGISYGFVPVEGQKYCENCCFNRDGANYGKDL